MGSWLTRGRRIAALAAALLTVAPAAAWAAGATRTWVSGVGDDANPCSRTAPCKTWAGALSKTASGGEIDALDSGGFGAVTITQPITLSATGVVGGVLVAGTNGIVIDTPGDADVVTLRGLDLNGLGQAGTPGLNGVDIIHAGAVHLENDQIYGFGNNGVLFAPTAPSGAGAPTPLLTVDGSQIHDNAQDAILAIPPSSHAVNVVVTNSTLAGDGCGLVAATLPVVSFTTSNCGVASSGSPSGTASLTSAQTTISGSPGAGVLAAGAGAGQILSNDLVTANALGLAPVAGGQIVWLGANSVLGNATDGTPTSQRSTGTQGPPGVTGSTGSTGATGPTGAAGHDGRVRLVSCRTVRLRRIRRVHGRRRKVTVTRQRCTTRLLGGSATFTTASR